MVKGPGYALGEFLADHGAHVTIHETVYVHDAIHPGTPPVVRERMTFTLPDGTQLGADIRFEEDA